MNEVLIPARESGRIDSFKFEEVTLKLAENTRYTPDFMVILVNGEIEFHEVKSCTSKGVFLTEDDANVKWKVAANSFPYFGFVLAGRLPKKVGGGWKYRGLNGQIWK